MWHIHACLQYLFCIIKKLPVILFQNLSTSLESWPHFCEHTKKPFDVTCYDWSTKITPIMYLEAIWFKFWMEGALVMVEICVICGWWFSDQVLLSNLFTVVNSPINLVDKTKLSCNTPHQAAPQFLKKLTPNYWKLRS